MHAAYRASVVCSLPFSKRYLSIRLHCRAKREFFCAPAFISFPHAVCSYVCAAMHCVPSCVCLQCLFANLLQYVLCSSDCRPFQSPGAVQHTLYKLQCAQSDAKEREPDVVGSII